MRVSVVLLFAFTFVLAACTRATTPSYSARPSPAPSQTSPAMYNSATDIQATAPTCRFADLAISQHTEGAVGNIFQSVHFKNQTLQNCTLQGRPKIRLVDTDGQPLTVNYADFYESAVQQELASVPLATRTVVRPTVEIEQQQRTNAPLLLTPQAEAYVVLWWATTCAPYAPTGYNIRVSLSGEEGSRDIPTGVQSPGCTEFDNATATVMIEQLELIESNP